MDKLYDFLQWQLGNTDFMNWYKTVAQKYKLAPNPYDWQHFYDYRKAYDAGIREPKLDETSGEYHWPSEFKLEGHPRTFVDGVNTKTGEKAEPTDWLPRGH
jgi:hypothetical protein